MDDRLIDDDGIPLARRTLLPGKGFFYPDSLDDDRTDERVREAVAGAETVVVADTDADGLGCVALLREAFDASLDVTLFEASIAARLADGPVLTGEEATVEAAADRLATADLPVDLPAAETLADSMRAALEPATTAEGDPVDREHDDGDADADADTDADANTGANTGGADADAEADADVPYDRALVDAAVAATLGTDADEDTDTNTDADADGTTRLEAAVDAERGSSSVALVGSGPYNLGESLARVAKYLTPGARVFVCDLCPDDIDEVADPLAALGEVAGEVRWFDHHQWDDDVAAAVREAGVDLVVGDSDEECTTDVTLRSLAYDFPERFRDLARVTRDHDLWLKDDERSDDIADYAYWADAEEYVTVVGHYGADLPPAVTSFIEAERVEKRRRIELAVDRAELREVGPWTVATTYGRCSQNEVADQLREAGADAAVIVKPAGSASLRGSEAFQRCHEVAGHVNGGGHPKAAGCKPAIYDDMLDYAHHWSTQGSAAKRVLLAAFERVAETEPDRDADTTEADAGTGDGNADTTEADADDDGE
jgi:oligoribonuclease NrnB/cAMP/cGMP phosphodiesterase (DHH superfamily)